MGNYVFDADALVEAVTRDADQRGLHATTWAATSCPYFVERGEAGVYDFKDNDVPGSTDRDRDYWRDVGTLDAYFEAQMDLVSVHPVFNLYNYEWPIYTHLGPWPPAKFVHGWHGRIGARGQLDRLARLRRLRGRSSRTRCSPRTSSVHSWATVSDSVLLDNVEIGRHAVVRRAILDKNVVVPEGARVGMDADEDRERGFLVTDSGITVVGKGMTIPV